MRFKGKRVRRSRRGGERARAGRMTQTPDGRKTVPGKPVHETVALFLDGLQINTGLNVDAG